MAHKNIQSIRRMVARLRSDPQVQAMIARNAFVAVSTATLVLDLNSRAQDFRHRLASEWCEAHATERWRRRISERRLHAAVDSVSFEFEDLADAAVFHHWLAARGW